MNEYEYLQCWLDKEADESDPIDDILKSKDITQEYALACAEKFRSKFYESLKSCSIQSDNINGIIMGVCELIKRDKSEEAMFLYTAIAAEKGLLFGNCTDAEQLVSLWLEHDEKVRILTKMIALAPAYKKRLDHLKSVSGNKLSAEIELEEQALLYRMALQHKFLNSDSDKNILLENTGELIRCVNANEHYRCIKPYIYSAVLSRKHKMMTNRRNYSPNLSEIFKYMGYKIDADNGKNYDTYQSYLELYEQLRRHYSDECDIGLSDYCFAKLSNLSEWYYENCEPNEEIPMTLEYAVSYYAERIDLGDVNVEGENPVLEIAYENVLSNAENWLDFVDAMQNGDNIARFCERLYTEANAAKICPDKRIAMQYAKFYLILFMEEYNRRLILEAAKQFR
ncbi:MAG: hypothetical protein WBK46_16495 [Ruminococcus flavefaciens]